MSMTVRLSEQDAELIRDYAKLQGITVSEFLRRAALEKIEDTLDLAAYEQALSDYEANPVTYSQDEVERMLHLK